MTTIFTLVFILALTLVIGSVICAADDSFDAAEAIYTMSSNKKQIRYV